MGPLIRRGPHYPKGPHTGGPEDFRGPGIPGGPWVERGPGGVGGGPRPDGPKWKYPDPDYGWKYPESG